MPAYVYTSPELYERERDHIFLKDWLSVGRVEEIERPGDYMTFRVMGEPIIITRDTSGEINAFANICRHRGVEVASGTGNLKEFTCPYHGWTYDLGGRLVGAPYMKGAEGFDPTSCRLRPLRSAIWAGWIFVTFDLEGEDFEDFVAEYAREYGYLEQENLRLADKFEVDFDCNWKLFVENGWDVYHIVATHMATIGNASNFSFQLKSNGESNSFYDSPPAVPEGKPLFGDDMPWMAGKADDFSFIGHLRPNSFVLADADHVRWYIMWPAGLTSSHIVIYTLYPPEVFNRPDFTAKIASGRDFLAAVVEEDKPMMRSLQHALSTRSFEPGHLSTLEELVYHGINHYLDRMFGDARPTDRPTDRLTTPQPGLTAILAADNAAHEGRHRWQPEKTPTKRR